MATPEFMHRAPVNLHVDGTHIDGAHDGIRRETNIDDGEVDVPLGHIIAPVSVLIQKRR